MINSITVLYAEEFKKDFRFLDRLIIVFILLFILSSNYSIAIEQITYFTALSLWLTKIIIERHWSIRSTPHDFYLLAFVGAEFISTIISHDIIQSFYYFHKRIVILPIIYLIANWIDTRERLIITLITFGFGILVLSIYGVVKIFYFLEEFLHYKRRLDLFQFSMTTSELFIIAAALIIPFILHKHTPKVYKICGVVSLLPLVISLVFTYQRGSWLGFLSSVFLISLKRSKLILYILVATIACLILIAPSEMKGRIFSIFDPTEESNQHRLNQWQTAWRIFSNYPIFGVGDIGMEGFFPKYGKPGEKAWSHLHSNIVTIGVKLGIVGLLVFLALFINMFVIFWKTSNKNKDDWLINSTALGAAAALIAFHVSGLFEFSFGDTEVIMYLWIVCGFATAAKLISDKNKEDVKIVGA